jgi:hypothetical protein
MRHAVTVFILFGALAASPLAFTAPRHSNGAQAAKSTSTSHTPSHAVRGVVKSVDASNLVISRSGKKAGTLSFVLDPSTQQEGTPAVGSTVSVRYRTDGKTLVATAVTAQPAKHTAHKSQPAK